MAVTATSQALRWWLAVAAVILFGKPVAAEDEDDGGDEPVAAVSKKAAGGAASAEADDEDTVVVSNEPWIDAEDTGYALLLAALCVFCGLIIYRFWRAPSSAASKKQVEKKTSADFHAFQQQFLLGYALNVAADWMQGPYVYKLYSFYGFSKGEIGSLFVAGFFSSMLFGTFAAGLADRFGRKQMCMVYSVVYAMSCLTKHSTNFAVLFLGRLLAGIATSILHSGFESWYVAQHRNENYPEDWMIETLAWMSFIKGLVAIVAAVVASIVAHRFGFVAPFDFAALFLLSGMIVVHFKWKENYGDRAAAPASSFSRALVVLAVNPKVWLLGFIQSCFEGAMYIFVFSWTPILEASSAGEDLPHGLVFGCFMVSIMIGSNGSQYLLHTSKSAEGVASLASAVASVAMLLSAMYESHYVVLSAFCLFEMCVGVYFPCIATQRAKHIPNEVRATVMGIFRVPLNLIVVLTLLNASQLGTVKLATFSAGLLALAFCGEKAMSILVGSSDNGGGVEENGATTKESA